MLFRMDKLIGTSVVASDGEIGKVKDVYFDDHHWTVRYLVVRTGSWLDDRVVLIPPLAVKIIDCDSRIIHLDLSMQRVAASPFVDADKALSRLHETELSDYYGYARQGSEALLLGGGLCPLMPNVAMAQVKESVHYEAPAPGDTIPRDTKDATGDNLQATGASNAYLEDFLID